MSNRLVEEIEAARRDHEKQRRKTQDCERKLDQQRVAEQLSEVRLKTLEEALALTASSESPSPQEQDAPEDTSSGRMGRQPGEITVKWRNRLAHFYKERAAFDRVSMLRHIKESEGRAINRGELTRTLGKHCEFGYLKAEGHDMFRVTEAFAKKYPESISSSNEEGPADAGPSTKSVGLAGLPGESVAHDLRDGSTPSSSSSTVKNGLHSTATELHATNQGGRLM